VLVTGSRYCCVRPQQNRRPQLTGRKLPKTHRKRLADKEICIEESPNTLCLSGFMRYIGLSDNFHGHFPGNEFNTCATERTGTWVHFSIAKGNGQTLASRDEISRFNEERYTDEKAFWEALRTILLLVVADGAVIFDRSQRAADVGLDQRNDSG
jgi:hypothetical protein